MKNLILFHRDFRIEDNETLRLASREKSLVCGILKEDLSGWGIAKRDFYLGAIQELSHNLEQLGHKLFYIDDLEAFEKIYMTKNYNATEHLKVQSAEVIEVDQRTLFPLAELPFELDKLPKTFTPFRHKMDKLKKTAKEPFVINNLPPMEDYGADWVKPLHGQGESIALERLSYYFGGDFPLTYFETRNGMVDFDDSTKFSPYLAWGTISPQRIFYELKQFEAKRGSNKSTYWIFFELLWRDYFKFVSHKFGDAIFDIKGTAHREVKYVNSALEQKYFNAWKNAQTQEPFVNANMNELNQTGWMSNRGRQNVASYLAKTLNVNWTLGARYFEHHLIDFDIESNYGNWAYLAGVGVDPRDRKFNIARQEGMYDPEGEYVSKWT